MGGGRLRRDAGDDGRIINWHTGGRSYPHLSFIINVYHKSIMLPQVQRISERILKVDNFENVAHVCCDWEEFVFEVAEWGVDHICGVDFDDLSDEAIKELDTFIASFGCSPSDPHPCSKYASATVYQGA